MYNTRGRVNERVNCSWMVRVVMWVHASPLLRLCIGGVRGYRVRSSAGNAPSQNIEIFLFHKFKIVLFEYMNEFMAFLKGCRYSTRIPTNKSNFIRRESSPTNKKKSNSTRRESSNIKHKYFWWGSNLDRSHLEVYWPMLQTTRPQHHT